MENIRLFETQEEYIKERAKLPRPSVSYIEETQDVSYDSQPVIRATYKVTEAMINDGVTEIPLLYDAKDVVESYYINGEYCQLEEIHTEKIEKEVKHEFYQTNKNSSFIPTFDSCIEYSQITTQTTWSFNRPIDFENDKILTVTYIKNIVTNEYELSSFACYDAYEAIFENSNVIISNNDTLSLTYENLANMYSEIIEHKENNIELYWTISLVESDKCEMYTYDSDPWDGVYQSKIAYLVIEEPETKTIVTNYVETGGVPDIITAQIDLANNVETIELKYYLKDEAKHIGHYRLTPLIDIDLTMLDEQKTYFLPRRCFNGCGLLTSIIIPDQIIGMFYEAFYDCNGLTSVTIGKSITSLSSTTFRNCYNISSIVILDSVTSFGDFSFNGFESLTSVTIGNSVTSIGDRVFYACESLASIEIPDSVTSIGQEAFAYCENLTSVTIGNSVTSIGISAFTYCDNLTEIVIPDSVTSIGYEAFGGCYSLTSVTIGNSVTSIGDRVFYACESLTSIVIPNSVTSIGNEAFYYCDGLTSVTIGNSVTSIGNYAFSHCTSLISVTIPDSVTSIGYDPFEGCIFQSDKFLNNSNLVSDYNWGAKLYDIVLDNGLCINGTEAVNCRPNVTEMVIPDYVTSIGEGAFYGKWNLLSVTISNSVTSIGNYAFEWCYDLTSITCNAVTVPTIGSDTFRSVAYNGILYYPQGSDYSAWMAYLSQYNWTSQEIEVKNEE